MLNKLKKLALFFVVICLISVSKSASFADTTDSNSSLAQVQAQQTELQKQLQGIEKQISQYQKDLKSLKGQKNTLQNKISQLQKQQASLKLQIKSTALQSDTLAGQIAVSQTNINQTNAKIDSLNKEIGDFLETIYENDNSRLLYIVLNNDNFGDVLREVENYAKISEALSVLLDQNRQINEQLNSEQQILEQLQDGARNLLVVQGLQQQDLSDSVGEQSTLLKQTKNKESNYQASLKSSQKQASAIRSRLYQLLEVANQINFGQAVQIAQWASGQTGVRAAFLLSILTQESNLGRNVGTCNRAGDPPSKSYKVIMSPTRDQAYFLQITKELGLNPDITPVSCPMRDSKGNRIGWGGAMGPAQFIPSTWMGYKNKVSAISGKTANPWDIRDAFLASAIKLAAGGATSKSGEWAAAMRYFSGSTNTKYRFYGDSVVARADQYQSDIDEMNK
jgi:peptidoglycan hydrolase CwlO-like protein